jgi:NADH-quinone oxidoreductase subunit C
LPSADTEAEDTTEVEVDEGRSALLEAVSAELGDAVVGSHLIPGRDLWVRVSNEAWGETASYLRDRQRFRFFDWLSAVDWLPSPFGRSLEAAVDVELEAADADSDTDTNNDTDDDAPGFAEAVANSHGGGSTRFQVMARVYSLSTGLGINVKTDVDANLAVPTWIDAYPGAAWHEREAFEMFGIEFDGNEDLRNLYLPTDFEGHPLRKDYPLMARLIKPWPGIVDVEPMPELDEPGGASTTNPEAGQ